jgi:PleD family two-component response regulator
MKILVADDDLLMRMVLVRHLSEWGFEVKVAVDGAEAWQLLSTDARIRLAILDWEMPGCSGPEICRRLTAADRNGFVYTILLTARSEDEFLVEALERGAHSFLSKPLSLPVLRSHVAVGRRLVEAEDKLHRYASQMEALADSRAAELIEAERLARTDALTGAINRRGFLERAETEFQRARR